MKILKNKITLYGSALMIAITLLGFIADEHFDRLEDQKKHDAYARIIPLIGLRDIDNFETKTDKVRAFLFEHTVYSDGEEFHTIWGNHQAISDRIIAHAKGEREKRTPLDCSARSGALESILHTLGYKVRSVSVYKHAPNYPSHTVSEVQNPETREWHIQDVQNDLFWRLKKTGKRASAHDIIKYDKPDYEPCRTNDLCVDWELMNREKIKPSDLETYHDSASIIDRNDGSRPFIVDASRFDLEEPVEIEGKGPMTYCVYREKNCRDNIIVLN